MPLGIGFMGNAAYEEITLIKSESQMPLGIGFMGNGQSVHKVLELAGGSQMPLGIGFMGNICALKTKITRMESQMPLGIGFMGNNGKCPLISNQN